MYPIFHTYFSATHWIYTKRAQFVSSQKSQSVCNWNFTCDHRSGRSQGIHYLAEGFKGGNSFRLPSGYRCRVSVNVGCWLPSLSNSRPGDVDSESHLKLKSWENAFGHNLFLSCQIIFKFCTGHSSITTMLCAKFLNDSTVEMNVMDE